MKSDVITIDNRGKGFTEAVEHTKKVADYRGFKSKDTLQLQMITEELLSLVRSVAGEVEATFWIEAEGRKAMLYLTTQTVMDKEQRQLLISAASSRQNEKANTFLGMLRDRFEAAMIADPKPDSVSEDVLDDLPHGVYGESDWDGYESSILRRLSDEVKVGIRGGRVEMTVCKWFSE